MPSARPSDEFVARFVPALAAAQSSGAFHEPLALLAEHFGVALLRYFRHHLPAGSHDLAEDCAQDLLLQISSKLPSLTFVGFEELSSWLWYRARWQLSAWLRKQQTARSGAGRLEPDVDVAAQIAPASGPLDELVANETWERIVARLTPAELALLTEHLRGGHGKRDVPAALGRTDNAVYIRLSRMRKKLDDLRPTVFREEEP